MEKKIVFVDVDGTLCNDNNLIPESAIKAIRQARANGHLVFICTGRSMAELYDEILNIGFDGIIGAGGGYIEIEGEVILHKNISLESLKHVVNYLDAQGIDYYLESNSGLLASENLVDHLNRIAYGSENEPKEVREARQKGLKLFIEEMIQTEEMIREDVNKISFLESTIPFDEIKKEFEGEFNVIPCTVPAFGEQSGEILIPGVDKRVAIEIVLEHLGIGQKDTIAIGDGMNDELMLKYCHIGIAMGNAKAKLKEIADDVTLTHDEGGIYAAFEKYGLI